MANELKPCPFCGKAPRVIEATPNASPDFQIFCICEAEPIFSVPVKDRERAILAWNTRTAPAKGEAELDNDNGLYSLALAVVDHFTDADPHVQVEAGKCALREAQDALDGFAKGAVPRQPVPPTLGKGNAEGTAPSAPTPEPAKHTEDCDRVRGFSRNCSCAPTPGDRVREAARRLITACRQHDIGGVGTVQEYLNAQHALGIELAKTEAALNTPAPADGEGKVMTVASMVLDYFNRAIDFDLLMRGRMDERDFIQKHGMTKGEYQRLDHGGDEKKFAHLLKAALAEKPTPGAQERGTR